MPRAMKWILGVLAVLVIAIGAVLALFQWEWVRQPAVEALSEAIGRKVEIARLDGEWSLYPRFVVEDIRVQNAEWAGEEEMLEAERVEVVVDVPELLRGRMVLPEIKLIKPQIRLARQEDGTNNWTFGAEAAADVAAPEERSEMPLIGLLLIEEGKLAYRDRKSQLDLETTISTAVGSGKEGRGAVELEGRGSMRGEPFLLQVTAGSLLALRETDDPYPLVLQVVIGPTRLKLSGTLEEPIKFAGLDLEVALTGPNLGRLRKVTGVPFPLTPRYDLRGRLTRDGDVWAVADLQGTVGESNLAGDVKVDSGRKRLLIEADLHSSKLDYRDVGPLIGLQTEETDARAKDAQPTPQVPKNPEGRTAAEANQKQGEAKREARRNQPAKAGGQDSNAAQRVLPDVPLAVEQIREVDAKVKFRGEKVVAPGVPLSGVDLVLEMQNGVLHLKPIKLGVAGGNVIADIRINAREPSVSTNYDIRLNGFDLQRALAAIGQGEAGKGVINGRIRLLGIGDTVRQSLGSATGEIGLYMDDGQISNLVLELIGLDVGQALLFFVEGDRGQQTVPIRCFVADFAVQDGVARSRAFVLDTTDTTVTADGSISLRQEQLDLRMLAHPKDASLLSARTPIDVQGSFAKPQVNIVKTSLVARAAGALALGVVATPLASVLAFIEPGLEQDADCAALEQSTGQSTGRTPK